MSSWQSARKWRKLTMCSDRKTPWVCSGNKHFAGSHCDYCATGQHKLYFQELFLWGKIAHVLNTSVSPAQTCSHANRETLMSSAWHIMARALGTAVTTHRCSCHTGQSHPGRSQDLLWVAECHAPRLLHGWAHTQCMSRTSSCLLTGCLG